MNPQSCYERKRLWGKQPAWQLILAPFMLPAALLGQIQHQAELEARVRGDWLSAEYCSALDLTQTVQAVAFRADNLIEWRTAEIGAGYWNIGRYAIVSEPSGTDPGVESVRLIVAPASYADALISSVLLLTWTNFSLDFDSRFPAQLGHVIKARDVTGGEVLLVRNTTKLSLQFTNDPAGPRFDLLFEGPFRIDTALERSRDLEHWSLAVWLTNRNSSFPPLTETVFTNVVAMTNPTPAFYRAVLFPVCRPQKHLVATNRLADIAPSQDGEQAWAAMETGTPAVVRLSSRTGEVQEALEVPASLIQRVFFTGGSVIALADSAQVLPPGPELSVYETQPRLSLREAFRLADWRLYRVGAAALSLDGQVLWATSSPNMSSLYGRVHPALFRISVRDGSLQRILGPPSDTMDNDPGADLPDPLVVSVDAQDAAVVFDPEVRAVRWFSKDAIEQPERVPLDFVPTLAPARISHLLPLIGGTRGVVLDTVAKTVISRFQLPGPGTAVCIDGTGTNAFVAIANSSKVLQLEATTGSLEAVLDLSRPGGIPDIADAVRGKEVANIVKLHWLGNPARLLALGFDGYVIIVADL